MSKRTLLFLLLWFTGFAAGLSVDRVIAQSIHDRGWDDKIHWSATTQKVVKATKIPGTYICTILIAVGIGLLHPLRWRAASLIAVSGALSGLNSLLKWIVGRRRPITGIHPFDFDAFVGGLSGLFGAENNLSFPSGHACLAFATAASLGMCLPRWRIAFYSIATIVAIERICENAHYISDSIAGAGLGILSAIAGRALLSKLKRTPVTSQVPAADK